MAYEIKDARTRGVSPPLRKGRYVPGKGRVDKDYSPSPHSRNIKKKDEEVKKEAFRAEFAEARRTGKKDLVFSLDGNVYNTRYEGEAEPTSFEENYLKPQGLKSLPYYHEIDPTEGMTPEQLLEVQRRIGLLKKGYDYNMTRKEYEEAEIQKAADAMTDSYEGYYQWLRKGAGLDD